MKLRGIVLSFIAVVEVLITAQAQTLYYKADNSDSLDLGTSWTNNLGTPPGALDTAIWDSNVLTPANCTNSVGSPAWGGIRIANPAATVQVTSTGTLMLGGAAQNAIDMTGASQDLWLGLSVSTVGDQNWVIPSGRTLSIGNAGTGYNVKIANSVGVAGHVTYLRNLQIQAGGTLYLTNSSTLIEPSPAAAILNSVVLLVGGDATVNNVVQTAGTLKLKRTDGTTGNAKTSMQIGGAGSATGVYTITGGSLQDVSALNTATFNIGDSANANGTLNVDGTGSVTVGSMRLANAAGAVGTLNITNGTVTITGNSFDVGRTTGSLPGPGTVNLYGGSLFSTNGMNVPHGQGPGFLNLYGGNVVLGANLSVPDNSGTGAGTVNVNGGTLTLTSGNINLTGNAGGPGTVNLNGGVVTVGSVQHPGTASGTLVLNGGTLRARSSQAAFIATAVTANVGGGGAVIDSAGYDVTIPAALLNGTGGGADGGLTKIGPGTLTLSGANSYKGATRANAGGLNLYTTNFPGGSITVSNNALLHVILGSPGRILNCSSLSLGTLGAGSGGAVTLEFDLNGFSNPAVPLINAASLAAAGTVGVTVIASGLSEGTYHLVQYSGNISGSDFAFAANVLGGAVGYVTNNTATHYIDMVVTGSPSLVWRAQVNTNWDINASANWVDLTNGTQTTYPNGAAAYFDDSASNTLVYAMAAVSPSALSISNAAKDYSFTGVGRISGVGILVKQGTGMVTMALTNDYSGDTVISNGTFRLAGGGVIPDGSGKGDVTLEGKLDLAGFSEAINGLNGNNGVIDNSGAGAVTLTVGNGGANGIFGGQITNSTGSLALAKAGGGSLVLLAKNGYTGGTSVSGALQLAYEQSIGTGPLALGGSLLWTDTAAHTLTNPLTITGGSTFGASSNGLLTVTRTVDLGGANRTMTCNSEVVFANGATNGGFSGKTGPGTLIVQNFAGPDWTGGSFGLNNGTLVLDNAAAVEHANNIRIQCTPSGGTARLVLTNGASLTMMDSATSNFRFGDSSNAGVGVTNVVDLAGTLSITAYAGSNNKFQMGSSSDPFEYNIVNLLPGGVLRVRQVIDSSTNLSIFNFNGGTLSPNTNDMGSVFMQNLDYCNVQNGGAVVDTAGWDVTINQPMLAAGTGGVTKTGAGSLTLSPDLYGFGLANTYTGDTVVNGGTLILGPGSLAPSANWVLSNGAALEVNQIGGLTLGSGMTLKGSGVVLGYVYVNPGGTLSPGSPTGTLGLDNAPALGGALLINLHRSGLTVSSGMLSLTNGGTLTYGGTLTVANIGGALRTGDTFKLFNAGSYAGAFTAVNLPAGVTWDQSKLNVNGTISVLSAPAPKNPKISSPVVSGGNLVLTGSDGAVGGLYYVRGTTNLALPLSLWPPITTNVFAADGKFTNSIPIDPAKPTLFLNIEVP